MSVRAPGDILAEPEITRSDLQIEMPAARCRGCGAVTWTVSLMVGLKRKRPKHLSGCHRPPGRLDLQARLTPAQERAIFGTRLRRYMTNQEVAEADALIERDRRRARRAGNGGSDGAAVSDQR